MVGFFRRFLNVEQYQLRTEAEKAQFIYLLLGIALLGFGSYIFFVPNHSVEGQLTEIPLIYAASNRPDLVPFLLFPPFLILTTFVLLRVGSLRSASWAVSLLVFMILTFFALSSPNDSFNTPVNLLSLTIAPIAVSLLNGSRGVFIGFATAYILFLLDFGDASVGDIGTVTVLFSALMFLTYYFVRLGQLNRIEGEKTAGLERVKLAEITTQLTRLGSQRVSMKEALNTALSLIQTNYPQFYHVQIFLIEETGVQAQLIASTGQAGQQLLARGHGLAVGSLSVIGQTTFQGKPIQVDADSSSASYRPNDLLPDTKTEAAFPIRLGNKIIGALDLQSIQKLVLDENDNSTYQSLADSLALVIDNIRQFEGARVRVEENQRLTEQARNALSEVQRLNKRLIGRAWSDYLKDHQDMVGIAMDFDDDTVEENPSWTKTLEQAIHDDATIIENNIVAVPLRVRGQVIGALEVELNQDGKLSNEDLGLLQEIGERFGLAAENTRLIEQSQRAAQREALINVVSSRLQTTNNVESTLAEAARSLSEMLQAERVVIRLGKPTPKTPSRGFREG